MKDTINYDGFVSGILQVRPDNFTILGLRTLYDYFEQLEQDTGEEIEFDPIAICCEFAEYDSLTDLVADYWVTIPEYKDVDIDYFEEQTIVIPIEKTEGFIIQQF
jgi:hypothetical protein